MRHASQALAPDPVRTPLDEAIDQATAAMEANPKPRRSGDPGGPRRSASRKAGPAPAADRIAALADARRKRQTSKAETLFRLAREAGVPAELAQQLASNILPTSQKEWPFVMISPQQNAEVIRWINRHSKRPQKAVELWGHLFEVLRLDTGEILRSRDELALRVGISVQNVSEIMGELASINAVRRERRGRGVRYFMNANIATHLPGHAARREAQAADGPLLMLMEGGASA